MVKLNEGRPWFSAVAHVAGLDQVAWGQGSGQLDLVAVVVRGAVVPEACHTKGLLFSNPLDTIGVEEPQPVDHQGPAEGRLIGGVVSEISRTVLTALRLKWGRLSPVRFVEICADASRELVAAALGDRIDDATGESAVLGRDSRRQHLSLFDGVLNEEIVRRPKNVVVDVDTVDEKDVVVAEPTVDRELAGVGGVVRQSGRQFADPKNVAAKRQRTDVVGGDVYAVLCRCNRRRDEGHDLHRLRNSRWLQRDIGTSGATERNDRLLRDLSEPTHRKSDRVDAGREARDLVAAAETRLGGSLALERW